MKITVIGAGSAVFSLTIIRDICLTPSLANSEVCLMDINQRRLDAAYLLCIRYAEEMGVPFKISKTLDRLEALLDASFVVNTAATGHEMLMEGWEIAKKHGYRFGGSLHIMHDEAFWANYYQLELIESVYEDMRRICPDAWYVLVSNPVLAATTMLLRKYPNAKMVGLCQGSTTILHTLDKLGLDRNKARYQISGINHFIWMTHFEYDGRNGFDLIDNYYAKILGNSKEPGDVNSVLPLKGLDLYKTFGAYPLGDTVSAGGGSWAYWYHSDTQTERIFNEAPDTVWRNYFRYCSDKVKKIEETAYDRTIRLLDVFPPEKSDEITMQFIEAVAGGEEKVLPINILNNRQYVPGIPTDFEVEIYARCSRDRIEGLLSDPLPRAVLAHLFRDRIAPVEVELEAFRTHSRSLMIDLIMMDPWTKSRKQAESLFDDILKLPWASGLKAHYNH